MLVILGKATQRWMGDVNPWTNVYGTARTLLAASTALTLAFNHSSLMFRPAPGGFSTPVCMGVPSASLFCLFPADRLEWARWVAIAILALAASGWRPRLTALPHWWISFSFHATALTTDGGDQATSVLTLLLLPLALTDRRRWHWVPERLADSSRDLPRALALSALVMIRLQVAAIYLHAATAKFEVEQWTNGTALYYWLSDPLVGAADWLMPLVRPFLLNGITVTLLTWSVMVLELFLAAGLVTAKASRGRLLVLGILLHAGIALVHGLVSFGLTMVAALILFLRPLENPIVFRRPKAAPEPRPEVVPAPAAVLTPVL